MWALNTPPASVRLFTDLPLAHFEDVRERTGNELGHTLVLSPAFSASRLSLGSFFLWLALTHRPLRNVLYSFFAPTFNFPPFLSAQAVSWSLNAYVGKRAPAFVLITKVRSFLLKVETQSEPVTSLLYNSPVFTSHRKIALSALKSYVIVYILFPHSGVLSV